MTENVTEIIRTLFRKNVGGVPDEHLQCLAKAIAFRYPTRQEVSDFLSVFKGFSFKERKIDPVTGGYNDYWEIYTEPDSIYIFRVYIDGAPTKEILEAEFRLMNWDKYSDMADL